MEQFTAPMLTTPMLLSDDFSEAAPASRPTLVAGAQPVAAVLLVEIDALETVG